MEEEVKDPFSSTGDDFFGELKDYKPEEVKDDGDFKPLKGSYITVVKKLVHQIGVSERNQEPYDFYSLGLQVVETIDGDKGNNRYLNKRYQNTNEGIKKLMNDLFTAGIEFSTGSREEFDCSLTYAIDKQIKIRAWVWTPDKKIDGTPIPEEDRVAIQQMKITKEFKKGKSTTTSEAPF